MEQVSVNPFKQSPSRGAAPGWKIISPHLFSQAKTGLITTPKPDFPWIFQPLTWSTVLTDMNFCDASRRNAICEGEKWAKQRVDNGLEETEGIGEAPLSPYDLRSFWPESI